MIGVNTNISKGFLTRSHEGTKSRRHKVTKFFVTKKPIYEKCFQPLEPIEPFELIEPFQPLQPHKPHKPHKPLEPFELIEPLRPFTPVAKLQKNA